MNYLLHFRHLGFIGFLLYFFFLSTPIQASIIQFDCNEEEGRSFVIKSRSLVDTDNLVKNEPSKFRENDPKRVWKVSYDLKSGKGSINKATAKVIRVSDPDELEFAPAFLYSEKIRSSEIDQNMDCLRGFDCLENTTVHIRIDNPLEEFTQYFAVIDYEKSKIYSYASDDAFYDSLEIDETTTISKGFCNRS